MFDLTATGIRSLAIVFLVVGGLFLMLFLTRLRQMTRPVRRLRRRPQQSPQPLDWSAVAMWPIMRDGLAVAVCAIVGGLGLSLADSLTGFAPLSSTDPITPIGILRVTELAPKSTDHYRVEFQPTNADGEPIGRPIVVQGFGDSVILGYTVVATTTAFRVHGSRFVYKIDFVGTKWAAGAPDVLHAAKLETIAGGRVLPLVAQAPNERAYPYDLWAARAEAKMALAWIPRSSPANEWIVVATNAGLELE